MSAPLHIEAITGVILAGGRGSRMGGVDKGLQNFNGVPLALHTLMRLSPQVGKIMINANRNLAAYESFGVPVWPDSTDLGEYAGPLAGFLTVLERVETPYLLTVPCRLKTPYLLQGFSRHSTRCVLVILNYGHQTRRYQH